MSLSRAAALLPGIFLAGAIALLAGLLEWIETLLFGHVWLEALVLAILLGSLLRTLWTPPPACDSGLHLSGKLLLEIGIVLLGATTSAAALLSAGWPLLVAIVAVVSLSIPLSYALGRTVGLGPRLATLIACGNSICGNSAIAAVAPVIGAEPEEVASSIGFTAVLGIGTILLLPIMAGLLGYSEPRFGMLAGLTVYAVPQVLAATAAAGAVALHLGTIVKLVRVLMLGPVCLVLSIRNGQGRGGLSLRHLLPWFIIGFLLLMLWRSSGFLPDGLSGASATASHLLTTLAMAALGLGVDLRVIRRAGGRVTLVAAGSLVIIAVLAIAAIAIVA